MENKTQVLMIGGGSSFKDDAQALEYFKKVNVDVEWGGRDWKEWLAWSLEDKYEFLKVKLPTRDNAKYEFWKVYFEKYLEKINVEPVIIAHSLGTIFILKYLLENGLKVKIKQLHLVAPIVANEFQPSFDGEDTGTFTIEKEKVAEIAKYCEGIYIWHSTDDTICDYKNAQYLKENIVEAKLQTFSNRGHFLQTTFLELFDILRK